MDRNQPPHQSNIIQGSDVTLHIVVRNADGDALDLTGATEITVRLRRADRQALEKRLSRAELEVTSAITGRVAVALSDADTDQLNVMPNAPIELWIDYGSIRRIAQIRSGINVIARLI